MGTHKTRTNDTEKKHNVPDLKNFQIPHLTTRPSWSPACSSAGHIVYGENCTFTGIYSRKKGTFQTAKQKSLAVQMGSPL
jgi:hypothetical protein